MWAMQQTIAVAAGLAAICLIRVTVMAQQCSIGGDVCQQGPCVCEPLPCDPAYLNADIALMIDASISLSADQFNNIKNILKQFACYFTVGGNPNQTQFAMVPYARRAESLGFFDDSWRNTNFTFLVDNYLMYLNDDYRNIDSALAKVYDNLGPDDIASNYRNYAKHIAIVFSGNQFSSTSWAEPLAAVQGVYDLVLAVGTTANAQTYQQEQLLNLTKGPDPNAVYFMNGLEDDDVLDLMKFLLTQSCNLAPNGNYSFCTSSCPLDVATLDIAVLIDGSMALDDNYFTQLKQFLKRWAAMYTIGQRINQVQFSYVTFTGTAVSYGSFGDNSYNRTFLELIIDALQRPALQQDRRNLTDGLNKIWDNLRPEDSSEFNSGWRTYAGHLLFVFSGAEFGDSVSEWSNVLARLQDVYDVVAGVDLRANSQLRDQLLTIVNPNTPANVKTIRGPNDLDQLLPWIARLSCSISGNVTRPPPTTAPPRSCYRTCQDYFLDGRQTSGVYPIQINNTVVNVYCEMYPQDSGPGGFEAGGYTTFLSRDDSALNFDKTYEEYRLPFGAATSPRGAHWLGLENIYWLTNTYRMKLHVELQECCGDRKHVEYNDFKIGPSDTRYTVNASGFVPSDTVGITCDAFNLYNSGYDNYCPFSTRSTYNPNYRTCNGSSSTVCNQYMSGGWWFGSCKTNPNGVYTPPDFPDCYCNTFSKNVIHWCAAGNSYYFYKNVILTLLPYPDGPSCSP